MGYKRELITAILVRGLVLERPQFVGSRCGVVVKFPCVKLCGLGVRAKGGVERGNGKCGGQFSLAS